MAAPIPDPAYDPLRELDNNKVENIESYRQGGFHPIVIGDILGGRYGVYGKLGSGQNSTVWLCLDRRSRGFKWCAVKVMTAESSTENSNELWFARILRRLYLKGSHLSPPWSHFWIEGPNGRHLCFVSEVLGPSVIELAARNDGEQAKYAMFQAAEALQCLHQNGICHGNFRPANILFRFPSLGRVNEDGMRNLLGLPRREAVVFLNEEAARRGPRYVYEPKALPIERTNEIAVIDFEEAFEMDYPSHISLLPQQYNSPETFLDIDLDSRLDIWALMNTILEVRTGETMFEGDTNQALAQSFETKLGTMPQPYNTAAKLRMGEDAGAAQINVDPGVPVSMPLDQLLDRMGLELEGSGFAEIFRAQIGRIAWITQRDFGQVVSRVPDGETEILADLLRRSFRYDPAERLDLAGVMGHEWFAGRKSGVRNPGAFWVLVELFDFIQKDWRVYFYVLVCVVVYFFYSRWQRREVVSGICKATGVWGWDYSCCFVRIKSY